jgi:ABC-type dipeptide/oligopeptide/nickel transport system permease subunit
MYSEFWLSVNESPRSNSAAITMMAFGEFIQISFAVLVGCVVGMVLAYFSFRKNNVNRKLSYIALIFNSIPLLIVTIFLFKGILYGV